MLIIEIAVGVFLGGMGLWLFVSHRDKKKKTEQDKRQEQLEFSAAERYITERFKTLSAECVNDFRGHLATIFDDSNRSPIEAASHIWELSRGHLDESKKQIAIEVKEALKESFSIADRIGARERLDQHIDRLVSASISSLSNELMLMYVKELQSFNDDDLPSITHGHPRKQFNIGNAYRLGENADQDYKKVERLLRLSASQGYADAQGVLGEMYYCGEGVEQSYQEAYEWYTLAASQGSAFAQNILGLMYANGRGVEQDYQQALQWHFLSAAQMFPAALCNLGVMYSNGEGTEQDHVAARMLFNVAAAYGDVDAQHNIDEVNKLLTPDEIAEMDKLAKECETRFFAALGDVNNPAPATLATLREIQST